MEYRKALYCCDIPVNMGFSVCVGLLVTSVHKARLLLCAINGTFIAKVDFAYHHPPFHAAV